MSDPVHIPVMRSGKLYESLDQLEVVGHRDGQICAKVSQANAGLVRRDLKKTHAKAQPLRDLSMAQILEICKKAAGLFLEAELPAGVEGTQGPDEYLRCLAATSGLPVTMGRANMKKVASVLAEMGTILRGLTRGLDLSLLDDGVGVQDDMTLWYAAPPGPLGVVLPSNSPGVNSLWIPAVALKVPVVLKPGREEPWTPWRIVQAMIAAGFPAEAFSLYPTTHDGAATILDQCARSLLFGDENTTRPYASNPSIEIHGPGRSKVLLGPDQIDRWDSHLDVILQSVLANGGRSCVNASSLFVPSHGEEIATALAKKMATVEPASWDDESAGLSAFANPKFAEFIDQAIDQGVRAGGAKDVTAEHRSGDRRVVHEGATYLRPTVIHCDRVEHDLARSEYLFPFVSVVEVPADQMLEVLGPSLVVSAITKDPELVAGLKNSPDIHRLNLGPIPTTQVAWDQPHEGNLFEFLYQRRAIGTVEDW